MDVMLHVSVTYKDRPLSGVQNNIRLFCGCLFIDPCTKHGSNGWGLLITDTTITWLYEETIAPPDRLVNRPMDQLLDQLIDWVVNRLIDGLVGRLTDWLVGS
jgi:hypothetical protein